MRYGQCLGIIFLVLVGCSSKPVKKTEVSQSYPEPETQQEVEQVPVAKIDDQPASRVQDGAQSEEPTAQAEVSHKELQEAYKSQNDEAIFRASTNVLSQNSRDVKALNALGLYNYRKGRFLAAKYFFARGLAISPKSAELLNNQGLVSMVLDEPRDAIRYFRRALESNPSDGFAAANLGAIYIKGKDYTKAQFAFETAAKNGMRDTRVMTNYGIALTNLGKYEQARSALDEAIKMNSNNKEAVFASAILNIDHMKQYAAGMDDLSRLKFLGPAQELRNRMNDLEKRAKAGIK